jgi:hypothetical protein
MMDVQLLKQADIVLSKCGRPIAPQGTSAVCFYRGIPIQAIFPTAPTAASQTITREISGDTTFLLRAISCTSGATTALLVQIQLPNGRFLISNLAQALTFAGYGSWRYHFSEELECPPGTKITVSLVDENPLVAQPIMLLFEGADRYLLKGGHGGRQALVSDLPRYRISGAQNILAPCWMAGEGPVTPQGFRDEEFTYVSDVFTMDVNATDLTGTVSIPIDHDSDFLCRRIAFQQATDIRVNTPGLWLGRMRDSSGYALMDDYLDLIGMLNGAPMPGKPWRIEKGGQVFIDVQLVGAAGTGNVYLTVFMEGVRRYRA